MKPLKISKILIPFGFNVQYIEPIKMGVEIASKSNATLTLVCTTHLLEKVASDYVRNIMLPISSIITENNDKLKNEISNYLLGNGIELNTYVLEIVASTISDALIDLNSRNVYDLIIIPDNNKSSLDRLFSDINAIELMQITKTAVIAVPEKANVIKRIVLPIRNVNNWYDKIPFTLTIAKITGASIYIIGVGNTNSERAINQIKNKVSLCIGYFTMHDIHHYIEYSFCHGDPAFDVYNLSLYKNADLIVISPPANKSKLKSYLNTSMYNKLMEKGNIPIMGVAL